MSLSLKDHRFNRLQDCATTVLHHMEDISQYLLKYPNITNGIAILDRNFVDMEILKPILATITLLGIHITRPFQYLLTDPETSKYSILIVAFKKLYENLTMIPPEHFLKTEHVATFVSKEMFQHSLPEKVLLRTLTETVGLFSEDILILLQIALKLFADGFSYQKGNIFCFGPEAEGDCGTVLKIGQLDEYEIEKLDKYVPTHNILSERLVGETNYELHIRGKANMATVSKNMVIKKSIDLISTKERGEFKKYRKAAKEIQELRVEWNEKMAKLQEAGYGAQEIKNLHQEQIKLKDLEFLKSATPPGPFTKKEEVLDFMKNLLDEDEKCRRLYVEVRYARVTSQTLPKTASVFRLRTNGKYMKAEDYANNLAQYLDNSQSVGTMTISDLRDALVKVKDKTEQKLLPPRQSTCKVDKSCSKTLNEPKKTSSTYKEIPLTTSMKEGDHLIVFWDEGDQRIWYLGVVDEMLPSGKVRVNHFKRGSKQDYRNWYVPEDKDLETVSESQILAKDLTVLYPLSGTRVRCVITQELVDHINDKLDNL